MLNEVEYLELSNLCRRRFGENGADILHDLILSENGNYAKIKALALTQNHYALDYQTTEHRQQKEYNRLRTDKKCGRCKVEKPAGAYYIINKKTGRYLCSYCKDCVCESKKQWIQNNRTRENKRLKDYYEKNKQRLYQRQKLNIAKNGGYKALYQRNPEKYREYNRQWRQRNPEKIRLYKQRYRAKLKAERG